MKPYIETLPEIIRIGPFDIHIIRWPQVSATATMRWGEFSASEQVIRIDCEMVTPFKAVNTLLHEIGHAISWAYEIKDEDKEERRVSVMATAWTQVYRDNRWLLKWIYQTLHGESNNVAAISLSKMSREKPLPKARLNSAKKSSRAKSAR